MIIGLAKNNDDNELEVDEVAKGLFVVRNAYAGDYDFFESSEELFLDASTETVQADSKSKNAKLKK